MASPGQRRTKLSTQNAQGTRGRTKARQKFQALGEPIIEGSETERENWLKGVCNGFVSPSQSNKEYYRVILETLWPKGHGIPGPRVSEREIRAAINAYRRAKNEHGEEYAPYNDPFRRVRELMGEEGLIGIGKQGHNYQLVSLELGAKRKPRVGLNEADWKLVVDRNHGKCPVCGRSEPEIKFDQDHKIPRTRGGGDELDNWQALCVECNNQKSMACRGCNLECQRCGWAFPEQFAPLRIESENLLTIRQLAKQKHVDPHTLINDLLREAIGRGRA